MGFGSRDSSMAELELQSLVAQLKRKKNAQSLAPFLTRLTIEMIYFKRILLSNNFSSTLAVLFIFCLVIGNREF